MLSQSTVEKVCDLYFESLHANNSSWVPEVLYFSYFRLMAVGNVEAWNNSVDF